MRISTKQYAQALYEAVSSCQQKELPVVLDKFVSIVRSNNHSSQMDRIVLAFDELWDKNNGVVRAKVSSFKPLSSEARTLVETYVRRNFSANSVEIEESVDPDLLGGVVVECGDRLIDASLQNDLRKLKEEMIK